MFKAKIANLDVMRFDDRSPVSMTSIGNSHRAFRVNLGLVLDPLLALRTGATWVEVQILRQPYITPTVLDDIQDRASVIDNIKTISEEVTQKYDDFLKNDVLIENVFSLTDVLNAIAPDLAYEYNEGSDLSVVAAKLPLTPVMTVKRKTKKQQLLRATKQLKSRGVGMRFTYPELDGLLEQVRGRPNLSVNTHAVSKFSVMGPTLGKTVSNIMHYPFPVSKELARHRDRRACPKANLDQQDGTLFLKDSDFHYVDNGRIAPGSPPGISIRRGGEPELTEPADVRDVEARTASPFSSLSTVYREFIAYNTTRTDEIFSTVRKMKLLPFSKSFTFFTSMKLSNSVSLKIVVKNQNGVVLSVLKKDVDLLPLLADTSRPVRAPEIVASIALSEEGSRAIAVEVTQRDRVAHQVTLMMKETPTSKFRSIGTFPLRYPNEYHTWFPLSILRGPVTLRAIAVQDDGRSSSAFTDTVISVKSLYDLATADGGQDQLASPALTTQLNAVAQINQTAGGLYDVTISTAIISDGEATIKDAASYYDILFLRRLVPSAGDELYGTVGEKGGEYVIDIATGITATIGPGGVFVDEQVAEGTYVYVIDGHARGEEIPNIASVRVVVRPQDAPTAGGKKTDITGIQYRIVNQQLEVRGGKIGFELTVETIIPPDMTVETYVLDATVDLLATDLSVYSIRVGDYSPTVRRNDDGTRTIKFQVPLTSPDVPPEMKTAIRARRIRSMGLKMPIRRRGGGRPPGGDPIIDIIDSELPEGAMGDIMMKAGEQDPLPEETVWDAPPADVFDPDRPKGG